MGFLPQILFALGALAVVELGLERPGEVPLGVAAMLALPYLAAFAARAAALRGRFRTAALLARLLGALPVLAHLAALALFGWRSTVARWTGADVSLFRWPSLALLLVLLPYAVFTLAAIDAEARLGSSLHRARRSLRGLRARMFASGLAPLLLYTLGSALVGLSHGLKVRIEEVAAWSAAFSASFFLVLVLGMPLVLRAGLDTVPFPRGALREVLEEVARRASFRCRELLVWRTGGQLPNAAIIGLWSRHRLVVFSDSLLGMLRPRELAAVYAHEIGHAARRHVLVFLAWTGGFFFAADLVAGRLTSAGIVAALGVPAVALTLWFLGFGWLSRRFELEADIYSIELLGEGESLASALEAVGGNLRDVASWRHFSPSERAGFLRRAAADPCFSRAFRRRLRRWVRLGVALFVVTAGLELWELQASFTADAAAADLRLGRFDEATGRVERIAASGRSDELARVAERAVLGAADALGERRPELALSWLRLGARAGEAAQERAARALELALAGRTREARALLAGMPPELSRPIEELLSQLPQGAAPP